MNQTFAFFLFGERQMTISLATTSSCAPVRLRRYVRHGMLPQLAAFEAVMRIGSVTQAAESLCIAQPTLSGHLRKLEEALDVRLFEPCGKRIVPTAAAQVLLQAAHEVTRALERCESTLVEVRSGAVLRVERGRSLSQTLSPAV